MSRQPANLAVQAGSTPAAERDKLLVSTAFITPAAMAEGEKRVSLTLACKAACSQARDCYLKYRSHGSRTRAPLHTVEGLQPLASSHTSGQCLGDATSCL